MGNRCTRSCCNPTDRGSPTELSESSDDSDDNNGSRSGGSSSGDSSTTQSTSRRESGASTSASSNRRQSRRVKSPPVTSTPSFSPTPVPTPSYHTQHHHTTVLSTESNQEVNNVTEQAPSVPLNYEARDRQHSGSHHNHQKVSLVSPDQGSVPLNVKGHRSHSNSRNPLEIHGRSGSTSTAPISLPTNASPLTPSKKLSTCSDDKGIADEGLQMEDIKKLLAQQLATLKPKVSLKPPTTPPVGNNKPPEKRKESMTLSSFSNWSTTFCDENTRRPSASLVKVTNDEQSSGEFENERDIDEFSIRSADSDTHPTVIRTQAAPAQQPADHSSLAKINGKGKSRALTSQTDVLEGSDSKGESSGNMLLERSFDADEIRLQLNAQLLQHQQKSPQGVVQPAAPTFAAVVPALSTSGHLQLSATGGALPASTDATTAMNGSAHFTEVAPRRNSFDHYLAEHLLEQFQQWRTTWFHNALVDREHLRHRTRTAQDVIPSFVAEVEVVTPPIVDVSAIPSSSTDSTSEDGASQGCGSNNNSSNTRTSKLIARIPPAPQLYSSSGSSGTSPSLGRLNSSTGNEPAGLRVLNNSLASAQRTKRPVDMLSVLLPADGKHKDQVAKKCVADEKSMVFLSRSNLVDDRSMGFGI